MANNTTSTTKIKRTDGSETTITMVNSNTEMTINSGVMSFIDGFPLWGPLSNRLKPAQMALIEKLYKDRLVVTDGITHYLFCAGVGSWSQLYSEVAGYELLEMTGINAPVNYSKALKWAYALAERVSFPISRVHTSICIGTFRLMFVTEYTERTLIVHFFPHAAVIDSGGLDRMYERIFTFVTSPITFPNPVTIPTRVVIDSDDEIISKILLPLRYDQKLDFLWRIGKAVIDRVTNPSVIVFFGKEGHEGKTKLAEAITRILSNAVVWVNEDLFGSDSKWPNADTVMTLCQKRILICDECKIKDGFSYNNIKKWTSEAPVTMEGRTGYLSQTAIIISNDIPFYEKAAVNNSIGRRLVIYHMKKNLKKFKPLDRSEITNQVAIRFISYAISIATAFENAPVSLPIALYTVFRKNVNKITAGLIYDVATSRSDAVAATCGMAMRCGVAPRRLCSAFAAISPSLVTFPEYGCPYVKSIRTRGIALTEHGVDIINKWRTANKGIIDLQAMLERGVLFDF